MTCSTTKNHYRQFPDGKQIVFDERLKPMLQASKVLKKHFSEYGEISTKNGNY